MADLTAEQWLAEHHPEITDFPTATTGRSGHEVELTDISGQYEQGCRHGQIKMIWMRTEALKTQGGEATAVEVARAERIAARPCVHCQAGEVRYVDLGWCEPCYTYNRRNGQLPGPALVARRRKRSSDISQG